MLDGQDVRTWPLAARGLQRLLKPHERLRYVDHVELRGREMFAGALALGLEGVVAKDGKSPYIEGPRETWHWLKVKNRDYKRQGKVEFRSAKH
jgi:bifunctional non-homologous end joining protein LigD